VCSDDGTMGLWDLREKARIGELPSDTSYAWKLKFLTDGVGLVSGGPSGSLCFWDLRTRTMISELEATGTEKRLKRQRVEEPNGESKDVYSLAVSSDGKMLACGRGSGDLSVMALGTSRWIGHVRAHHGVASSPVRALSFHSNATLLSGGDDNHVCELNVAEWAAQCQPGEARTPHLERFSAHRGWITSLIVSPVDGTIVTTSWDSTVKLWNGSTHAHIGSFKHTDSVWGSAFAEGGHFVTVGADSQISLYTPKEPAA